MSTETETESTERASRKFREGIVTSDAMDKTVVVTITYQKPHCDRVRVAETRPMSATKRWRLVEILEKAK